MENTNKWVAFAMNTTNPKGRTNKHCMSEDTLNLVENGECSRTIGSNSTYTE